jgi:hypothetical protein
VRFLTSIIVGAALLMVVEATAASQGQESTASKYPSEQLKTYLRGYLSLEGKVPPDTTTRITVARTDCDGIETEEDVVYVSGQRWCGSGGCTMLILEPTKSSFKVLGRVTIVQLPIKLLTSRSDGYPDIAVRVQGGGIQSGYEAVLSFNGKSYPKNPSMRPARKVAAAQGKVLIATTENSVPLYD